MLVGMGRTLSMSDVVGFIERVGSELDWSTRYMDLAATASAAVFRSLGLDEDELVEVGETALARQLESLEADLLRRGLTPGTARTYANTWRRVATLAAEWQMVRGTPEEEQFWAGVTRFRDDRKTRRTRAAPGGGLKDATVEFRSSADSEQDGGHALIIRVPLGDGVAVVEIPHTLTQAEAYRIVQAVIEAGAVDR